MQEMQRKLAVFPTIIYKDFCFKEENKMKRKKIMAIFMAAMMAAGATACQGSGTDGTKHRAPSSLENSVSAESKVPSGEAERTE